MPLESGEVSFHHACAVHGSSGNNSQDRRIGLCLHFVPCRVRLMRRLIEEGALCSAMLLRGDLAHDYFPQEHAPQTDCDIDALAEHAQAVESYRRMVQALGHNTASRFD